MDTTGRRFDPTKYLRAIKTRSGKQEMFLPVPARLLWLRADHPNASVLTEALKLDDRNAIFKATITLPGGAVAVGHGSEAAGDFGDFIEKAESKAIGRALAALGYGIEFAEMQEDSAPASATEVAPALIPATVPAVAPPVVALAPTPAPVQPSQPVQPPPPVSAPLIEAVAPRPERNDRSDRTDRYDARPERTEQRIERPERGDRPDVRTDRNDRNDRSDRPEPRAERTEQRIERPERSDRSDRPDMRNDRADRYAPPPPRSLIDRVPRPERPERMEQADELPLGRPLSTPTPIERPARPERISRSREALPAMGGNSAPDFPPMEEETPPAPTPIRRTGRTLIGRPAGTLPPLPGLPAPDAPPSLAALPAPPPAFEPNDANESGDAGETGESDDELEPATISTTSFWRWAKSKGYPDRRAVEAATGRSMDTMTPREAYFRLREVIARGTAQ